MIGFANQAATARAAEVGRRLRCRDWGLFARVILLIGLTAPGATAQTAQRDAQRDAAPELETVAVATQRDGAVYRVTRFELRYGRPNAAHPKLAEIRALEIPLGLTLEGYVAPRDGVPTVSVRLDEVEPSPRQLFRGSAIRAINERIFRFFTERNIQGVQVVPDPEQIEPRTNIDLRPSQAKSLTLIIWTGQLEELRTFASGGRIPEAERIDNPAHQRIKDLSPVQPGGENSLMRKDLIDDYVYRLNRHPGRNVDIALSAANQPGGVYLDYLIAENKPWTAYAQASNTGTDATTEWRERFGFTHNQLTGHDDVLTLDYVTGNFDQVHAVFGSYELPFWNTDRIRFGADGGYSEFDASELAAANFSGDQWNIGAGANVNLFQWRDLFIDVEAIWRFSNVQVSEDGPDGDEDFVTITPAIVLDWLGETRSIWLRLSSETNLPNVFGTEFSGESRNTLGRQETNDDFTVLRAEISASTYLEPLLFPRDWSDPTTPRSSTLAHELALDARGQLTPGDKRLVPQFEDVAGGLYTVRGYNQSVSAGDNSAVVSGEYRLHIPRLLGIDPTPVDLPVVGPFKLRGQQVYDQPDWDLIFRPFVDFGYISSNDVGKATGAERSSDLLIGVGAGLELSIRRNLIIGVDWGHALNAVNPDQPNEPGTKKNNDEIYFSATITY